MLRSLGLVFVLGSAITQVYGDVTIYSTGNVARGQTGHFRIHSDEPIGFRGLYVNFSLSGTAIPGVDYVALVSPAYIPHCIFDSCGVLIPVTTLPDVRGLFPPQAYSVVVKLLPGIGYFVGEPSSAQMLIVPQ